ncbi:MAG: MBL fold metallo-hydrolase [Candidatus Baltobacteraceae bacterium]
MQLHVVGSSPAMPRPGSACSSYLLRTGDTALLFDIGSGAVGNLQLAIEYPQLDAVVVTHMHADHYFDLVPLRYSLRYGPVVRESRLPLWLPPGGAGVLAALREIVSTERHDDFFDCVFDVREYDPDRPLELRGVRLTFCRTRHYISAFAIRAEHDGAAMTYSADTAPCDAVVEHARASALFLCEAALGLGNESGERGHTSAEEAGEMAQRAGAGHLLLTHYGAGTAPGALVEAAKRRFSGAVTAAQDGMTLVVA